MSYIKINKYAFLNKASIKTVSRVIAALSKPSAMRMIICPFASGVWNDNSQLDVLSSHEVPGCFAVVFSKSLIEIAGVAVAQHG